MFFTWRWWDKNVQPKTSLYIIYEVTAASSCFGYNGNAQWNFTFTGLFESLKFFHRSALGSSSPAHLPTTKAENSVSLMWEKSGSVDECSSFKKRLPLCYLAIYNVLLIETKPNQVCLPEPPASEILWLACMDFRFFFNTQISLTLK